MLGKSLKNKKIIKAVEKIDGSLMQPVLIDGKIYFKTKLSLEAYQAKRANEMLKNKELKNYILEKFKEGKIPIFEYISPKSQVVMDYKKEELSSSFVFKNPNETERCGCGESFKI